MELGYSLSSEEQDARALVDNARRAEAAGFTFALISDHYHPWTEQQGQSPFAWSVMGAIAYDTHYLRLGTGVTCPTVRYHPAIVAQMSATMATLMPGRFFLGVGTGENLNEHILGQPWRSAAVRLDMLTEAVHIIRQLWQGGKQSFDGKYYTLDRAQLYSLPDEPPELYVAAAGERSAKVAGALGDGLITTSPKRETLEAFQNAGGRGKPSIGQMTVCWAEDEETACKVARQWWPTAALRGELSQELPLPAHFEQATRHVSEDDMAKAMPCGPDPKKHLAMLRKYAQAGIDKVYVHQVGPDQAGFFHFYQKEIMPRLADIAAPDNRQNMEALS